MLLFFVWASGGKRRFAAPGADPSGRELGFSRRRYSEFFLPHGVVRYWKIIPA